MDKQNVTPMLLELAVSFITPSMLLGLTISHHIGEIMDEIGEASEEIFRGEHLPILKNK